MTGCVRPMDPLVTQYIGHVISSRWSMNGFTHERFLIWCCCIVRVFPRWRDVWNFHDPKSAMTEWAYLMGHLVTECNGLERRAGGWTKSALSALASLAFKLCFVLFYLLCSLALPLNWVLLVMMEQLCCGGRDSVKVRLSNTAGWGFKTHSA